MEIVHVLEPHHPTIVFASLFPMILGEQEQHVFHAGGCGVGLARSIHLFCDMIHHLFTGIIFVWVPLGDVSIEELQNVIDLLSLTLSGAHEASFAQAICFLHEAVSA